QRWQNAGFWQLRWVGAVVGRRRGQGVALLAGTPVPTVLPGLLAGRPQPGVVWQRLHSPPVGCGEREGTAPAYLGGPVATRPRACFRLPRPEPPRSRLGGLAGREDRGGVYPRAEPPPVGHGDRQQQMPPQGPAGLLARVLPGRQAPRVRRPPP